MRWLKRLAEDCREADLPISAKLLPEDERWKDGCGGLFGASDILDEDCDRPWPVRGGCSCESFKEFERFNAEAG